MWYFAWLLGLPLAAMFAVVNAMWLELQEDSRIINDQGEHGRKGGAQR
ncbi:cytochrome bd-I oxidase subunit CydX [Hoeflea sp. AS16]